MTKTLHTRRRSFLHPSEDGWSEDGWSRERAHRVSERKRVGVSTAKILMKIASRPANSDEATDSQTRESAHQFEPDDISELEKKDPYCYGWREIPRPLPNGNTIYERVPLTLEDILHPQVGDFRMHTEEHERFCAYLYNVLTAQVANDPTAIILHDVRVAWAHSEIKPHGPDLSVIFNVDQRQNWSTFSEIAEATKPSLIIEVTSPGTYFVDLEKKVDHYAQVSVPFYAIVDIAIRRDMPEKRLLGYQLTEDGYQSITPNANGWLWLAPVNLWLGWHGADIACYDTNGNLIEDYTAVTTARAEAEGRAAEAEERVRELEEELRRLRDNRNHQ